MTREHISINELRKIALSRAGMFFVVAGLLFFLPAGTWRYWEAWVYIAIIAIPMVFTMNYLMKNDPALLERRMKTRETQATQKRVVSMSFIYFVLAFLLPGFDKRFGWSNAPFYVVIAAEFIVLISYLGVIQVFKANTYASRVVEVANGQTVISTGPYAIVRHPMYAAVIFMYIFSPLALGSYWAMLPAILIIPLLVERIRNEEEVLEKELVGYKEYEQKTKYRIIPGVW